MQNGGEKFVPYKQGQILTSRIHEFLLNQQLLKDGIE